MSKDISTGKKATDFAEAVKGLLGLNAMISAIGHFNPRSSLSVIGSYEKSFDSKSNNKIKEYSAKIDKCNARLVEIDTALEELDAQKAAAENRKSEKVIELKQHSEGEKLQKEKEDLQKQIDNITRMRATVYKTMCRDFNTFMSPFFSLSLTKRALEVLSRHDYSGIDIPFIRDKTIEYLLKQKICLCGTHLDEGSVPYEKVKSLLDVIPPKSLSTYVTDFKKESKRRAGALQDLVELMQENLATASQQSDDIMDKTDELHKIEAKLSGEDVSEKVRVINNEIQICVKTINKCNTDRDKLNIERGGLEKERERADTERQNLTLLDEKNIPVKPSVAAACEFLGLDPLFVANEGKVIVICRPEHAQMALSVLRSHPYGQEAAIVGLVTEENAGFVEMTTLLGGKRSVDWLNGEQLPRIC